MPTLQPSREPTWEPTLLQTSNFDSSNCQGVVFDYTDLSQTRFVGAKIRNTNFIGARLIQSDFSNSLLTNIRLDDASLRHSNWHNVSHDLAGDELENRGTMGTDPARLDAELSLKRSEAA